MITDPKRLLFFLEDICLPQEITIRSKARDIEEQLKDEGYPVHVFAEKMGMSPWRHQ